MALLTSNYAYVVVNDVSSSRRRVTERARVCVPSQLLVLCVRRIDEN